MLPIKTTREGDTITKVCVEDVHKLTNKMWEALNNIFEKASNIIETAPVHHVTNAGESESDENMFFGHFITGTGRSTPSDGDEFNEEIGNEIAFRKAKLNANLKKVNLITKFFNCIDKELDPLRDELIKLEDYVEQDIESIRVYNPEYLADIEDYDEEDDDF